MGDDDERGASLLAQFGHQLIEYAAVLVVEVTAWLVGQYQLGVVHQGSGNGDPLLFAAGELRGEMVESFREAETLQQLGGPFFCWGQFAGGDKFGHRNIFEGGKVGEEVVELKDKADFLVSEPGQRLLGEGVLCLPEQELLVEHDLTAVGGVEGAEQVQQGCFAASRGTDDGHHLTFANRQIDPAKNLYGALARYGV